MSVETKQPAYTLVFDPSTGGESYTVSELQKALEKGSEDEKVAAMKHILVMMLDGNPLPELLMHIIRFVMPSKNKKLKKLLYFYWEIVPKMDEEGKLRHEMILVCNAIQHDLQHPNEYIRGNTLRFLTKLNEPELLEQMVPSVLTCLEYRHAYVRKYAILAVQSIYNVSEHLIPDAKDIVYKFLEDEMDPICKRNAFVGVAELDRESALKYLEENIVNIEKIDPLLQSVFVEFIRKDANLTPSLKDQYVALLLELLNATTYDDVVLETALALTLLTPNTTILNASVSKLTDLADRVSDNNVKLIVLDRVQDINNNNPGTLEERTLDILRLLNSEDLDVRSKALDISLDLISSRNAEDVIQLLKKELQITVTNNEKENAMKYRQLLIKAIRSIAIKFSEMAESVISLLLEFISELNSVATCGVISFVKDVIEKYPQQRSVILTQLVSALDNIKSAKAYRGALWILGEYSESSSEIQASWKHLRTSMGEVPIVQSEMRKLNKNDEDNGEETKDEEAAKPSGPVILPDGTYATESAFGNEDISKKVSNSEKEERPPLRRFILGGDFYTAAILASTIVKLVLKFDKVSKDKHVMNALKSEGLLILVSIIRVGQSSLVERKIDEDSADRIMTTISILMDENDPNEKSSERSLLDLAFIEATRESFKNQLSLSKRANLRRSVKDVVKNADTIETAISFRQFAHSNVGAIEKDTVEEDLNQAIHGDASDFAAKQTSSRLKKIVPLTGFSDPVYAEAYITNNQFDVVLEVLLVNQTKDTLKNLHVQFATLGDLKIIDNPPSTNIVPHGFHRITITVKVSSADTGVIFGNIIYDGGHGEDARYVILNDVHIDIMDYIKPSVTSDERFRTMWNEFEWENKISVKSDLPSLHAYLEELTKGTNMGVLTPQESLGEDDCRFLSCNLYAKSSFGEDALANLCIELDSNTHQVIGYVRIRSKGQGLALSLGDRVALIAKQSNKIELSRI
ncbi:similar to Saccharomyces cerevisiae YDR238C SEC26 Essential beta-coat protein of the COPI coatomer, involved in ER-to-Golgi protein trafficking and maintenance of normal ER morphology [Maudiozyma barnettii]|uniref:Coatomer subunit beta n=1 Tax=Maudiozyma barnettii TaxID=61262 RepID=A0A8H2ZGV8_9SACH|nr:coatomer subunit beta [Kazachstania barnettii]CAB4255039.1 similar to Saccharomyces cerevisiae YDR238C SEC26 Essential beta-coat protein of the COPI coatomer, involved in ER-to-Golgi protein trafficking and maintenance of normal ER morphology [Kazachstania barnettii]CAD1783310.1 similar to Saccharomyces cerevisiae YDR238C SEC26 Essential beta-coat protein of the COPI coatomer, involved in ER-to-Golgi protein trafficking and maintenance of normal ER morphology [Kazachstania barnettii]